MKILLRLLRWARAASFLALVTSCAPAAVPPESLAANANNTGDEVVKPRLRADGHPFQIAVVQSGDYFAYNDVLVSVYDGLAELGWVAAVTLDSKTRETIPSILRRWSQTANSSVEFPPNRFVDLNWTETGQAPADLKALLGGAQKVDLVLSLGTLAGTLIKQEAKAGRLKVPVLIESVSDPVGSKIIDSLADSGDDLISASADPEAYDRQIRLFHRVVGFQRLGMIYTDTDTGRAYAALSTVQKASQELGFAIVSNKNVLEDPPDPQDLPKAEDAYVAAMEALGPQVDAVYLTIQAGLTSESLERVVAVADRFKLPTFIMEGTDFVLRGALLGESTSLQAIAGLYSARKLTRVLAGATPRRLAQTNPHMPHIALNLAEAKKIGFDVPVDILLSADDVFTTVQHGTTGSHP